MSLPSVLLVLGFLIFLCYPALVAMLQIVPMNHVDPVNERTGSDDRDDQVVGAPLP